MALLSENGTEKTFEGQKTQIEPSTSDTGGNYLSSGGVEFTNFLLQQIEPSVIFNFKFIVKLKAPNFLVWG